MRRRLVHVAAAILAMAAHFETSFSPESAGAFRTVIATLLSTGARDPRSLDLITTFLGAKTAP